MRPGEGMPVAADTVGDVAGAAPTGVVDPTTAGTDPSAHLGAFRRFTGKPWVRALGATLILTGAANGGRIGDALSSASSTAQTTGTSAPGDKASKKVAEACVDGVLEGEDLYAASRPEVITHPDDTWLHPKETEDVSLDRFYNYLFDNKAEAITPICDTATGIGTLSFIAGKLGATDVLGAGSFKPLGNVNETILQFAANPEAADKEAADISIWLERALAENKQKYEGNFYKAIGVHNADGSVTVNLVPLNLKTIEPGTVFVIGTFSGDAFTEDNTRASLLAAFDKEGHLIVGEGLGLPLPDSAGEQVSDGKAGEIAANVKAGDKMDKKNRGGGKDKAGPGEGSSDTGGSAGPDGKNPEAGPDGVTPSPANGGGEGDDEPGTTTTTRPVVTTTSPTTRPSTTTSTSTTSTTIPPTTTTTHPIVTTTTSTAPTTPTTIKAGEGGPDCLNNPRDPRC